MGTVRYRVRQPLIMHTDSSGHKIIEQYLHVYTVYDASLFHAPAEPSAQCCTAAGEDDQGHRTSRCEQRTA